MFMHKTITSTIVVLRVEGEYLFIQRVGEDTFGRRWEFPGGKVEDLEDIASGALRELHEEVQGKYDVINLHQSYEFSVKAVGPKYLGYTIRFIVFEGDLVLPLVNLEMIDRIKPGPDHQAMALLSLSCLENFVLTRETQMVINKISKNPPI